MNIRPCRLAGVVAVDTAPVADTRGAFARFFCEQELATVLGHRHIVQINHSRTCAVGAVRGLHFQRAPHAEMKMVRCIRGRVWDVTVDLRQGSPTFLKWHAEELSAENEVMFVIPEGCAHGFQVLESQSELLYLHTAAYAPHAEGGLAHDDPQLAVPWPLPVSEVSERDRRHPLITAGFTGLPL